MCQLLAMNCNVPTDICFSFAGFQARGGRTDEHSDGWGIAFFEGRGVRQFLDSQPSAQSPIAEWVKQYPIRSMNVISHIRKATLGQVSLENTHPFMREIWGEYWIFAHNGHLGDWKPHLRGDFTPVGNTDSEHAFCYLLEKLKSKYGVAKPSAEILFEEIADYSRELGSSGEFNFLISNGDWMIVHCSTHLCYLIRQAPFQSARLRDEDLSVDFRAVTTDRDRVAVIATSPLTENESWTVLQRGTLLMFREGEIELQTVTVPGVEHDPER
jgi:predicted glutamine amidotransferase